jgi:hypothetical protein
MKAVLDDVTDKIKRLEVHLNRHDDKIRILLDDNNISLSSIVLSPSENSAYSF